MRICRQHEQKVVTVRVFAIHRTRTSIIILIILLYCYSEYTHVHLYIVCLSNNFIYNNQTYTYTYVLFQKYIFKMYMFVLSSQMLLLNLHVGYKLPIVIIERKSRLRIIGKLCPAYSQRWLQICLISSPPCKRKNLQLLSKYRPKTLELSEAVSVYTQY